MRVERIGAATLMLGDCRDILPTLSGVDACVMDPPYFRVKDEWWDRQWDDAGKFLEWLGSILASCSGIMEDWASLYCFASARMEWEVQRLVRQNFVFLNSIRWRKPQGWHMKQASDDMRVFQQNWEACIFAQKCDDASAMNALGYDAACDALHKRVFRPLGDYFKSQRIEAGLSYRQIADHIDRDSALYLRWEEGSSLPNQTDYQKCRELFQRSNTSLLRREYEDLRREYEDLRRPFSVYDERMRGDIWDYNCIQGYDGKHPCEKPLSVMEHIVGTSTKLNQLVVDGFLGSGTTGVACLKLGRRFVGIEKHEPYFDIACRRIEAAHRQRDLFIPEPTPIATQARLFEEAK